MTGEGLQKLTNDELIATLRANLKVHRRCWCRALVWMGLHPDDAGSAIVLDHANPWNERLNEAGADVQACRGELSRRGFKNIYEIQ